MKKRVSRFCFWNFWSHSAEKFRGQPLNVSEKLGYWKTLCILGGITFSRRNFLVSQCRKILGHPFNLSETLGYRNFFCTYGVSQFFVDNFCLTVPKTFVGIPSMFQKNWGIEKFHALSGVSQFFVEKFFSHSAEKFRRGILLVLRKLLVSKSSMDEKARITFLILKFLVSQCRKISWASPQCFRKIGILKNAMHTRGYHVFPSKPFGLTVPKKFVGIPSIFRKIWGIENFYALIGYHNFPSKIFVSQWRKRLWASLQCFRKIEVLKNFMHYGEYHSFLSKIFCLTVPKNFEGIPSMFQNIWCIEKFYV